MGAGNFKPFGKRAALDTRFADLYDLPVTNLHAAFPNGFKNVLIARMLVRSVSSLKIPWVIHQGD